MDEEKSIELFPPAPEVIQTPPVSYPDGGLQAWMTVFGCWLVLFCGFGEHPFSCLTATWANCLVVDLAGLTNAFGVYQDFYEKNYLADRTPSQISWIGSCQTFLMFSLSLVTGHLFDRGYYRWLLGGGTTLFLLGIMMLSLAKEYYSIFLCQGVCLGLGVGCMFAPALSVPTHHFLKRRALAIGLVSTGSSCGGVVFPIALNYMLASKSIGFGWSCRIIGFFSLVCLVTANFSIKTRLPPKASLGGSETKEPFLKRLAALLKDKAYMCAVMGVFLMVLGILFPVFFIQTFALDHGVDKTTAFYLIAVINGVGGIARLIANWLADTYGPMNMIIPFLAITTTMLFAYAACTTTVTLIVFCVLFGFFSGAYVSLLPSMQAGFAQDLHEVGLRIGFTFSIVGVGALVGSPIAGALLGDPSLQGGYHWWRATVFCGSMAAAATAAIAAARFMQSKRKGKRIV